MTRDILTRTRSSSLPVHIVCRLPSHSIRLDHIVPILSGEVKPVLFVDLNRGSSRKNEMLTAEKRFLVAVAEFVTTDDTVTENITG
jgi:hypothetical protein